MSILKRNDLHVWKPEFPIPQTDVLSTI
jgi:hypothetical protein